MSGQNIVTLIAAILAFMASLVAIYNTNFKRFASERIYERQLEVFSKLYKALHDVMDYSQLMTKAMTIAGENRDEYQKRFEQAANVALDEFLMGRVFLPVDVAQQLDTFFQKIGEIRLQFLMARDPSLSDGPERAKSWKEAGIIAHIEIPTLLGIIVDRADKILMVHRVKRRDAAIQTPVIPPTPEITEQTLPNLVEQMRADQHENVIRAERDRHEGLFYQCLGFGLASGALSFAAYLWYAVATTDNAKGDALLLVIVSGLVAILFLAIAFFYFFRKCRMYDRELRKIVQGGTGMRMGQRPLVH